MPVRVSNRGSDFWPWVRFIAGFAVVFGFTLAVVLAGVIGWWFLAVGVVGGFMCGSTLAEG